MRYVQKLIKLHWQLMMSHSAAIQYLFNQLTLETSDWRLQIKDPADTFRDLWACPECATLHAAQCYSHWHSHVSTAHTAHTWNMKENHLSATSLQTFTNVFHVILMLCLRKFELRIKRRRLSLYRNTTIFSGLLKHSCMFRSIKNIIRLPTQNFKVK
jgi:hypothetical protein